ncbi:zinc finger (C3HC4 RING finger) protein, putative, partial [Eimeria tenella]
MEQLTAKTRAFSDALQQAQHRAAVADQQRDEIASCFEALRAEREKLFKTNDEIARELQLLTETNKASEGVIERHQIKLRILEANLRRQSEAKAEADKKLQKFKERQEKQERKRLLAAAEDPSLAINNLLQEENETMR